MFGILGYVSAEPVTYTFVGSVDRIYNGNPEIVDGIIAVGDGVEFTFVCDQEEDGYRTRYSGEIVPRVDHENDSEIVDNFWCDYIGGTEIGPIGEITLPNPNYYQEWNFGLAVFRKENGQVVQNTSYQHGGSDYNWVSIENYSQNINNWQVGIGEFQFRVVVRNQEDQFTYIRGFLVLTYASNSQQPAPHDAIQNIIDETVHLIALEDLRESDGNKLINPLADALRLIDLWNTNAVIDKLNNFIRKVERYINRGIITAEDGLNLIDPAYTIIEQLQNIDVIITDP